MSNKTTNSTLSLIFFILVMCYQKPFAQDYISLEQCLEAVQKTNPIAGNKEVYQKLIYTNRLLTKAKKMPLISIESAAQLQSEALKLDIPIPDFPTIELPLYRFQLYAQAGYGIYDGNRLNLSGELQDLNLQSKSMESDIALYQVNSEIVKLYYNILRLRRSKELLLSVLEEMSHKERMIKKAFKNGVGAKLDGQRLELEKATLIGKIEVVTTNEKNLCALLSQMTLLNIGPDVLLEEENIALQEHTRPELKMMQLNKSILSQKKEIIAASNKPKLYGFIQAGAGYPNPFNFFLDEFSPFTLLGLKLSWPILNGKKTRYNFELLDLQSSLIDQKEEAFEWRQSIIEQSYLSQMDALEQEIASEKIRLRLQNNLIQSVESSWEKGVANANDYITEVNKKVQMALGVKAKEIEIIKWKSLRLINKGIFLSKQN